MKKEETKQNEYIIDASKRSLGRVASEAAVFLMGKNNPNFKRNSAPDVKVVITNASKIRLSEKKKRGKTYVRYSGYPGGLKTETLGHRLSRKGYEDIFQAAVYGMLPSNLLRPIMMKNLKVED